MQFHNLVTLTFQPFLQHGTPLDQPHDRGAFEIDAGFNPARLHGASKASLQTLVHMFYHRHGFEAYYIFLLPILVQLGFDLIERLRTPEAQQEHFPPIMKATRATLILCAKGLRDQGRNFFLSELVFRILQDKMNPVDVKLLKDWARIKGELQSQNSCIGVSTMSLHMPRKSPNLCRKGSEDWLLSDADPGSVMYVAITGCRNQAMSVTKV